MKTIHPFWEAFHAYDDKHKAIHNNKEILLDWLLILAKSGDSRLIHVIEKHGFTVAKGEQSGTVDRERLVKSIKEKIVQYYKNDEVYKAMKPEEIDWRIGVAIQCVEPIAQAIFDELGKGEK